MQQLKTFHNYFNKTGTDIGVHIKLTNTNNTNLGKKKIWSNITKNIMTAKLFFASHNMYLIDEILVDVIYINEK